MSIFHKKHRESYRSENSFRGIKRAAAAMKRVRVRVRGRLVRRRVRRFQWIDLDLNMSKDGVIENTHWGRPLLKDAFVDPEGLLSKQSRVKDMTHAEINRLHSPDGYVIHTVFQALNECARDGIGAKLEPKADKRFEDFRVWLPVKAHADLVGCRVSGYSLLNLGGLGAGGRRARAMRKAGIPAKPIR